MASDDAPPAAVLMDRALYQLDRIGDALARLRELAEKMKEHDPDE